MPKQFTLGKNERLKSRKQIELLFSQGKKFVVNPFRIFFVNKKNESQNSSAALQLGVGISTKNFKKAIERNKIKRLTKEAWRLQKNELKEKLASLDQQMNVFLIYTAKEMPAFEYIKEKVTIVLNKLSGKIDENNSSNS